jgi:hypothetical protein
MKYILTFLCLTYYAFAFQIQTFEIANKQTNIQLDNGTLWTYKDTDLFEGEHGWRIGDRVRISAVYFEGFFLENVSCEGCVPAVLQNSNAPDLVTQRIAELIYDVENETHRVVLDDQTEWFIGSWSSKWMTDWQEGDRILVTPGEFALGNATHLLINLDQLDEQQLPGNVRAELLSPHSLPAPQDENKREGRNWTLHITSAQIEGDNLIVEMDNHTTWRCSIPKKKWKAGDQVIYDNTSSGLMIKNITQNSEETATLIDCAPALFIKEISHNKKKAILSDGSIWLQTGFGKFWDWEAGDRLIVSKKGIGFDTSSHILINLEKLGKEKEDSRSYTATLVH